MGSDRAGLDNLQPSASQLARLERQVRFYRNLSAVLALTVALTLGLLILGRGQRFARAIRIDGQLICLVKDQRAAQAVHERILADARGDLPGEAALEEEWQDLSWPVDDNRVLSVAEAVDAVAPRVHVVVDAFAIEVNGTRAVVVASEQMARDVLEALKHQYVKPSDTIIGQQTFLEDVKISPGQARASEVVTEIAAAVKRLSGARRQARSYVVKPGDCVEKIAADHGMKLSELWDLNPGLRGRTIHPGDTLKVAPPGVGITVKTVKEVTREIELPLQVQQVKTDSLPKGQSRVVSPGTPARKLLREHHTYLNDRLDHKEVVSGQIIDPGTPKRVLVGTGERPVVGAPTH